MRRHRTLTAGLFATALVLAGLPNATAADAEPCAETWDGMWVCRNHRNAVVYMHPKASIVVDVLPGESNVFRCRTEGGWTGGGPHPYRWLEWVEGGWVKDGLIISETNPVRQC